jgi:probable addiction module antidote protein
MAKVTAFDAADYLNTREDVAAYLSEAFETGDEKLIAIALGNVARAEGFAAVAEQTGLTRQGLYKSLSADGNPEFSTILKVMNALDLQLVAQPKPDAA